jgi:SAM-dependent methyltransferase
MTDQSNLLADVAARRWFYPFALPDGSLTELYIDPAVASIHHTRSRMLASVLSPLLEKMPLTALDIASHQGWYSVQMAELGCQSVRGIEPRSQHIEDAQLITRVLGLDDRISFSQGNIETLSPETTELADVVLLMGLIYHLENPVAAIRTARSLCKHVCVIETQVGPHVSGMLDWGSHEFVRPIQGCFTIIDETDEIHGPEASLGGICLAPSTQTLLWVMEKAGFSNVALVAVPEDGYEQHRHGKRVMAVGYVDPA